MTATKTWKCNFSGNVTHVQAVSYILNNYSYLTFGKCNQGGRCGGLMVGALVSGSSGPGSSPGRGHCVVFLGKILYSHSASLHPGV